jgi:SAM-dependent methyltransferase
MSKDVPSKITDVASHYEFGENWKDFATGLSEPAIAEAVASFSKLVLPEEIAGQDMLDIGCGSGLHALAALRMGATTVTALDLDPHSVETTKAVLGRFATSDAHWSASVDSVFALEQMRQFSVVYSWGVLHHTGDMDRAIRCAAERVKPGGMFYLALYRKTPMCGLWRAEKWAYTKSPVFVRRMIETVYVGAFRAAMMVQRRSFADYVASYVKNRGMSWMTDVRDWLGGYPYESISEADMLRLAAELGMEPVRRFCRKPGSGLFGTGCDEYAFRKLA